jgi:hypothetical protein
MKYVLLTLLILPFSLCADLKSINGTIKFDSNADSTSEMHLNSTGLGIGVIPSANLHVNGNAIIQDKLTLGSTSGSSNLTINGSIGYGLQTVSTNTTLDVSSVILADTSSDNLTLTLPYAGNVNGRVYTIKKVSPSNTVTIKGGGNFIDDGNYFYLSPTTTALPYVKMISNGSQWHKLNISTTGADTTTAFGNLMMWYKFDDLTGTTATDSSEYGNHGTLNNISFSGNSVSGQIGNALSFDGNNDYIVASSNITYYGNSFTITAWFKTTSTGDGKIISTKNDAHPLQIHNGNLRICVGGCTAGATSIDDNQWHFAAVVGDGNDVRAFLDGNSSPEITRGAISNDLSGIPRIGVTAYSTLHDFSGEIDDVRVYNKALSLSEINAIFNEAF